MHSLFRGKQSGSTPYHFCLLLLSTFLIPIQVMGQLNANWTSSTPTGCSPLTVQFTDLSTAAPGFNIHTWSWDFGNGNTSQFDDVIATYTNPGTYTVSLTVRDTINNVSSTRTEIAYVTIYSDPVANLSADVTSGCAPLAVNFTDLSTSGDGTINSWLWDFGDGNLGSGINPTHTYTTAGDFTITLVVTDDNGCSDTRIINDMISVTDVATIDFTAGPQTGCNAPLTVTFASSVSPAGSYTYQWDFGDGNGSSQANPTYTYTVNGDYTVSLTVTDLNGCQETVTKTNFIIIDNPVSNFTVLTPTVCTGRQVQFVNNSTGANSFLWDFGDGNTSTAANPSHTYSVAGSYTVTLTADNTAGCSDFSAQANAVTVSPSPAAGFTATNNVGCDIPLVVSFNDNSGGNIVAWYWDFGNGNFSNAQNPVTTYSASGLYDVSLTVTSADGCQTTETIPNYVRVQQPTAQFTTSNTVGCIPLTVNFLDLSNSPADPITSWVWNFGDGNVSNQQSPSHTYSTAGQYTVTLTVTTAAGCQDTEILQYVEAGVAPNVDFDATPRRACVGEEINFSDLTTGSGTAWYWSFGDGNISSIPNPTHQYQDTGTFDIVLIVEYYGCRDTMIKQDFITIRGPVAEFTTVPAGACNPPINVSFVDQSLSATSWLWDFGDGNTSTLQNPSHTYTTTGNYTATLVIQDSVTGCTDTYNQNISITNPLAAFSANVTRGCGPLQVVFTNTSTNATSYMWDFGDGGTSTAANPTYTYSTPGDYTVRLIAMDGNCADTLDRVNFIQAISPTPDFNANLLTGCAPLNVTFTDLSVAASGTSLVNWQWSFGDGNSGSGPSPTHTYSAPGTYDVTLSVLDSEGCLASITKTSYVNPTFPEANFTTTDSIACPGALISFTNQSTGTGLSYLWDFGDGTTSTTVDPTHFFPGNGTYTVTLTVTDVNGCMDNEIKFNYVNIGKPTANFTADTTAATCPPLEVNFTDQSSSDVVSWFWDFGDGSTSTLANPSKIYGVAGVFDVRLIVTTAQGCQDTLFMDDFIDLQGPNGSFTFSPNVGCQPLDVTFTAVSPNPSWTYTWDFGDGVGGFGTSVVHTYYVDTVANPIMLIEDLNGCIFPVTTTDNITIQPLPVPSFSVNYTQLCLGQVASFTNTSNSDRPITDYFWDFGDGTTSTQINPQHTYLSAGSYNVSLRLTTIDGCVDTTATPVTITVSNPPTAIFAVNPLRDCVPFPVTFTESSTSSFPIVNWEWDFGDGVTDNGQNITPHIYTTAGNFVASLTVTDSMGCTSSSTRNITADPPPPVDFSAFQYGCAPITVNFTDETLGAFAPVFWEWNFGDGTTSNVQNPSHTYATNGNYTVSLRIIDVNGCENTLVRNDFIQLNVPQANFSSNAGITCPPQTVTFNNLSLGDTTLTYQWDFGDGSPISTQTNPVHTYHSSDTFDVTLIVTNIFGCADTLIVPDHVTNYQPPQASFTISDTIACVPENIVVSSTSVPSGAPLTGYLWDFGTGSGVASPNASFLYTNPGTYTVSLEITDANGCRDTASKTVFINPNPVVDFQAGDTVGCAITSISFTDLTTGTSSPVSWQWTFGDGNVGTSQNPVNTYLNDGTYDVTLVATDVNGCKDSLTKPQYIVLDHPNANFTASQTNTCPGTGVTFTDLSTGNFPVTTWIWDFGDGSPTASQQNPTHMYTTPGTYTVSLIISDGINCQDTLVRAAYIQVFSTPTAGFTYAPPLGCTPLTVNFTNTSAAGTHPIIGYTWDFGDGTSSSSANPSHTFTTPGTYSVALISVDANGCTDTLTQDVEALELPVVDFIADKTAGCAPDQITFTDLSTSPYVKTGWFWDFGDGTTSTSPAPVHAYVNDGVYTVKLVVTDQNGCQDSLTKTNYIRLSHPTADFTLDNTNVCPNLPVGVTFTDLSTPDTTLMTWNWDFGDGNTSVLQNPTHSYSSNSTYTISLIITNVLGCRDTVVKANALYVFDPPTTNFSMADSANCTPLSTTFTDLSAPGESAIVAWNWDFGNGDSSLVQNPGYTWNTPGVYTVTLTTTDANGCQNSYSRTAESFELPVADFMSPDSIGCAPTPVQFIDQTSSPYLISSWAWDFGDGNTSTLQNPSHTYAADGVYTVSLTVIDQNGCTHSTTKTNYIRLTHPVAEFSLDNYLVCRGSTVNFTDLSVPDHPLTDWFWDFGDGTTSTLQNPSHLYHGSGSYVVSLTVTNNLGCTDTETKTAVITVYSGPTTQFTPSITQGCAPQTNSFNNTTTPNGSPITAWDWDFGDGTTSNVGSPSHAFPNPGSYTVTLIATDGLGCTDTATETITIFDLPNANFVASDSAGCAPINITFFDQSTGPAPISTWNWDFGDGNTSTSPLPVNPYTNDGRYTVSLHIVDVNGCRDSLIKPLYIQLSQPDADFTVDQQQICPGTQVNFRDASIPDTTLMTWFWEFGDGTTSNLRNPSHIYPASGFYEVRLTVTNVLGCGDTEIKTNYIEVFTPPTPAFTPSDTIGCPPLAITFTDNSIGNSAPVVDWYWDFGNGNTAKVKSPTTTFNSSGSFTITLTTTDFNGCTATTSRNINTYTQPTANFFSTDTTGCAASVDFFDISTSPFNIVAWKWYFGDGDSSMVQNPVHSYAGTGVYDVTLIITDEHGCMDTLHRPNYINLTRPTAAFIQDQDVICPGSTILFLDTSIPDFPIVSWDWDFGDGSIGRGRTTGHTYNSPGIFQVILTITNSLGCIDTAVGQVEVLLPPTAQFTPSSTVDCTPFTVDFTDASIISTAPIIFWQWDFGDGTSSNAQNPTHTYTSAGFYTITLSIIDGNGCTDDTSMIVESRPLPVADYIASLQAGCAPQTVNFNSLATGTNTIVSWEWDFGDGTTSTLQNPSHVYSVDGLYTVTHIVTDIYGCSDTLVRDNDIRLRHPQADFTWGPTSGCNPLTVNFADATIPDTTLASWLWDFGDGTSSTQQNPFHIYTLPGTYSVSLITTNILGCQDTIVKSNIITVYPPPVADFIPQDTLGCMPFTLQFVNLSQPGSAALAGYLWDFRDGPGSSSLPNPSHTFTTPGVYSVEMVAIDARGCRDTATYDITVSPLPAVAFTASDSLGCAPRQISFVDQSIASAAIISRLWDFGDGTTSTSPFPTHTYTADGIYTVSLTITDANGCVNTLTKNNYIRLSHPLADFNGVPNPVCTGTPIYFTDISTPDTVLTNWRWDFGDGNTSTRQNPAHVYNAPGFFDVTLIITNINGCEDTVLKSNFVEVLEGPTTQFVPSATSGCWPLAVNFTNNTTGPVPVTAWFWDFGNGQTSTFANPSMTYNSPGVYPVRLIATDTYGCTDTFTQNITVFVSPAANFMASDTLGCAVLTTQFLDMTQPGSAPITNWWWSYGDGNGSNQQFPVHTYPNDGTYTVQLAVEDANGCRDTLVKTNYIRLSRPTPDFTVNLNNVCPGTILSFTDLTIPDTTIAAWFWDFGDGNTSNQRHPSHAYTTAGTYTVTLTTTNILGCSETISKAGIVDILTPPTTLFSPSSSSGCVPFDVTFVDNSTGTISPVVSWNWDFGDGNGSTAQNPAHTYPTPGTYMVTLTTTDNNGCSSSFSRQVVAETLPLANFQSVDTLSCPPSTASFTDLSKSGAGVTGWIWDFGDGNTSLSQNPTHTYVQPGRYNVTLIATDANGCRDTLTKPSYIQVSNPIADFSVDKSVGCPGERFHFTDLSNGDTTILNWMWDFGDGTFSIVQNPKHIYKNPGKYNVSLTITNVIGCSHVYALPNAVTITTPPDAQFALANKISCTPFAIDITDNSQVVSAPIVQWHWDFGNGDTSSLQEPPYVYTVPGSYTIRLITTDAIGCSDSTTKTVTSTDAPIANFTASDSLGCAPTTIKFTDISSGTSPVASIFWDFGDGITSVDPNPSHTYNEDGVYTVTMIISDIFGCSDTITKVNYIRLSRPRVSFASSPNSGCVGTTVTFQDLTIADTTLTAWEWSFGDGNSSIQQNPVHTYTQDGVFDVSLIVTNINGCQDTLNKPNLVDIFEPPTAAIVASDTFVCVPSQITFTDWSSSPYGISQWEWFLDGVPMGNGQSMAQYFTQPGSYEATLVVVDNNGCIDTTRLTVFTGDNPVADFVVSDTVGCADATIAFNDLTQHVPVSWLWEFGDGNTSTQQNPIHTYTQDGIYTVKLSVVDQFGCTSRMEKINHIALDHPEASFIQYHTPGCPPVNATFKAKGSGLRGIANWRWDFGDGDNTTTLQDSTTHDYTTSGIYTVSLTATDSIGCSVTVTRNEDILVLSDVVPDRISIYAVTVLDDSRVEVKFAPHNNTDFLQYTIYREEQGVGFVPIYTSNYVNDTIYVDQGVDCTQNAYCYKVTVTNHCGTESTLSGSINHCTMNVEANTLPGQILVDWTPYIGWPVQQYEVYRVNSYNTFDVSFLGIVPGSVNRYTEVTEDCWVDYSYRIKAIGQVPIQESWSDTAMTTSTNGTIGAPNEVVRATVENNQHVLVEWEEFNMPSISLIYLERAEGNQPFSVLTTLPPGEIKYIDTDVEVGLNSYSYRVSAQDSCGLYTPLSNIAKTVYLEARKEEGTNFISWSEYKEWRFGVDSYRIEVYNDTTGQYDLVDIVRGNVFEYEDRTTTLDQPQYCYRVWAVEQGGNLAQSLSNEVCLTVEAGVHTPNAFTPNQDGVNDYFYLSGIHVRTYNLKIFSRWGLLVFESNDINEGWDGKYNGQDVSEGVYSYVATGRSYAGKPFVVRGTITLLR